MTQIEQKTKTKNRNKEILGRSLCYRVGLPLGSRWNCWRNIWPYVSIIHCQVAKIKSVLGESVSSTNDS